MKVIAHYHAGDGQFRLVIGGRVEVLATDELNESSWRPASNPRPDAATIYDKVIAALADVAIGSVPLGKHANGRQVLENDKGHLVVNLGRVA